MARTSPFAARWATLRSKFSTLLQGDDGDTTNQPLDGSAAEEILFILRQRGGRVRRQTIVAEMRWRETKVKRLLQVLDAEGHVEHAEQDGETIVALPGRLAASADAE